MKTFKDHLQFDSGRSWEPYCGVIGIDANGNLYEDCTGEMVFRGKDYPEETWLMERLTPEERVELAIEMTSRWIQFAVKE
ncbi:hypothetical protein LCGC14_0614600 [marine sediment metagenome]|uniref:Uncharacterized protein n=1 Tax=marine sediment metagenome TaxID=412755 RepID=A0A0F9R6Q7_9ZZZZ